MTVIDRYPLKPASDVTRKAECAHRNEHQHQHDRDEKLPIHVPISILTLRLLSTGLAGPAKCMVSSMGSDHATAPGQRNHDLMPVGGQSSAEERSHGNECQSNAHQHNDG